MKSWEKRLSAWLICVLAALAIWSGLRRAGELIPVRGMELPGRAVELLTGRVENGEACPAVHGLHFREVYTARNGQLCFVNGCFDAEGTAYRYAVALYQVPFTDWYLYDTTREMVADGVGPEKTFRAKIDFLFVRYHAEVFYDQASISRGLNPDGVGFILFMLLGVTQSIIRRFYVKEDEERRWVPAAVSMLWLLLYLICYSASHPAIYWVMSFG